ncbi:hypothetical protein ACLOJK_011049 [Asimina triloba]
MGSLQLLTSVPFLPKPANSTPTVPPISTPSLLSDGCFSLHNAVNTRRGVALHRTRAVAERKEMDENPEGIISGEWTENFSLLTYDDLCAYLKPNLFKEKTQPSVVLREIMSTTIRTATPDQTLEEVDHYFEVVSGLPVLDDQKKCIGIVSKKDTARALQGVCFSSLLKSKVHEVMSFPAITLPPNKTVLDAAALMLKNKIHRIPIVNETGQVIGMVTRTDIFQALENQSA